MSDEFDEDWEEQMSPLYEYDDEDILLHEEEFSGSEYEEEFEERYEEEPESPEFGSKDPIDWSRISFGKRIEDLPKTAKEKALRDPRSVSLNQIRGAINNPIYNSIKQDYKEEAYNIAENLPEKQMILYNIDILAAATLFTALYQKKGGITKVNIASFLKMTGNLTEINHLDFVRYIRALV